MSKISNKLAAGVRKVKAEQQVKETPKTLPQADSVEPHSGIRQQRQKKASVPHPARVWPD